MNTEMAQVDRPPPIRRQGQRDKTKFCKWHSCYGHDTNDCTQLSDAIEDLVRMGRLSKYLRRDQPDRVIQNRDRRREPSRGRSPRRRTPPRRSRSPRRDRQRIDVHVRRGQSSQQNRGDINSIAGGFASGGCSHAARRKYLREVLNVSARQNIRSGPPTRAPPLTFDERDYGDIIRGHDDPMIISGHLRNRRVRRLLVDQGSSADIMFYTLFQKLGLADRDMDPYHGHLVGFTGASITPVGSLNMWLTLGDHPLSKTVKVRFIVVDCPSAYNAILGRPTLNALEAVVSTVHLTMKFCNEDLRVCSVKGDQKEARNCYHSSLEISHKEIPYPRQDKKIKRVYLTELDVRDDEADQRPQPEGDKVQVQIGPLASQTVQIGSTLPPQSSKN